jgi:hypothetical protein
VQRHLAARSLPVTRADSGKVTLFESLKPYTYILSVVL